MGQHVNFLPQKLPAGTEEFYNCPQFSENTLHILSLQIDLMTKGLRQGLEELRKTAEGTDQ